MSTRETELAQALDAAVAAYQRHHGRPATLLRLQHIIQRGEAAQRILDDSKERMGSSITKAAE